MNSHNGRSVLARLVATQENRCCYCKRIFAAEGPKRATLEHVKAKMDGGTDSVRNLKAACQHCNQLRGAQMNAARQRKRKEQLRALAPLPAPG